MLSFILVHVYCIYMARCSLFPHTSDEHNLHGFLHLSIIDLAICYRVCFPLVLCGVSAITVQCMLFLLLHHDRQVLRRKEWFQRAPATESDAYEDPDRSGKCCRQMESRQEGGYGGRGVGRTQEGCERDMRSRGRRRAVHAKSVMCNFQQ